MAKLRLAGKKKKSIPRPGGAIPCIAFIILGVALLSMLFYAILKPG